MIVPYVRNKFRQETINRYGTTAGLPLFADGPVVPDPPKAIQIASDTRNSSHRELKRNSLGLTAKQVAVLDALRLIGPASNEELRVHMGWEINRVVGRVFELRKRGDVVPAGKRKCKITNNVVHTWRVK